MTEHTYVSQHSPNFKITLVIEVNEKSIRRLLAFTNKQVMLNDDDPEEALMIRAIDALIAKRSDISAQVRKVDIEEALRIAKQHQELVESQRGTMTGVTTASEHLKIAQANLMKRDMEAGQVLDNQPDMQVTESVPLPVASEGLSNLQGSSEPASSPSDILKRLAPKSQ